MKKKQMRFKTIHFIINLSLNKPITYFIDWFYLFDLLFGLCISFILGVIFYVQLFELNTITKGQIIAFCMNILLKKIIMELSMSDVKIPLMIHHAKWEWSFWPTDYNFYPLKKKIRRFYVPNFSQCLIHILAISTTPLLRSTPTRSYRDIGKYSGKI